jgi:hypothetical protein
LGGGTHPHGPGRAARLTIPGNASEREPLAPGTPVLLRETWQARTLSLRPVWVVDDVPRRQSSFYFAPGSTWLNDPRDRGEVRFLDDAWELEPMVRERPVLSFGFPDTPYAVLLTWSKDWATFEGYYVNIQSPLRWSEDGFDYVDWFLDVRVSPTRDSYEWKDEHELEEAVQRGLLTRSEAHDVRWAGERAIEHVLLHEPPFDREWSSWRPDPSWGPLDLPDTTG